MPMLRTMQMRIFILAMLAVMLISCDAPTGVIDLPQSPPTLEEDAASIPWSKLSGKIGYVRAMDYGGYTKQVMVVIDAPQQKLTQVKSFDFQVSDVTLSADGSALAYVRSSQQSYYYSTTGILKADTGNGIENSIYSNPVFSAAGPVWLRDGRLAYWASGYSASNANQYSGVVYVDNTIFYRSGECARTRPAVSPDGIFMIVVVNYYPTQPVLYKVPVGSGPVQPVFLSNRGDYLFDPTISPDGRKVVFAKQSYNDTTSGLWIVNVDASGLKRLTNDGGDRCPSFSPNGSQIVFERTTGSSYPSYYYSQFGRSSNIYLVNVDGSDLMPVTVNGGSWPTWIQ